MKRASRSLLLRQLIRDVCCAAGGGGDEAVLLMFSIDRKIRSTKASRRPTRGAIGNGLRVVAGAVLCCGKMIEVTTCGRRLVIKPQRDNTSKIVASANVDCATGTRITVAFDNGLPEDDDDLSWANRAIEIARPPRAASAATPQCTGFDLEHCSDLSRDAGRDMLVRDFIRHFDGCSGSAKLTAISGVFPGRRSATRQRYCSPEHKRKRRRSNRRVSDRSASAFSPVQPAMPATPAWSADGVYRITNHCRQNESPSL
jgi:hypothetical protein